MRTAKDSRRVEVRFALRSRICHQASCPGPHVPYTRGARVMPDSAGSQRFPAVITDAIETAPDGAVSRVDSLLCLPVAERGEPGTEQPA
jgi:hypothetical protein